MLKKLYPNLLLNAGAGEPSGGAPAPTPAPAPAPAASPAPAPAGDGTPAPTPQIPPGYVPAATVEEARRQEKEKQFKRISELENENKTLKADVEKLKGDYATLSKTLSDKAGGVDVEAAIKQAVDAYAATVVQPLRQQIATLEADKQNSHLERVRQEVIAKAGGKIIPELVRGANEAEILESATQAEQVYARTIGAVSSNTNQTGQGAQPTPPATPPLPNPAPAPQAGAEADLSRVKEMTMDEYKQKRESLKPVAASRYPRTMAR